MSGQYTGGDWFILAEKTFTSFLNHLKGKDDLLFMEIGVFEGRSVVWQLKNILTGKNSKIICIDTFEGSPEHELMGVQTENMKERFLNNVKPYQGKYKVLQGKSIDVLRTKEYDNKLDMVYIDGSHTASDTISDMCLTFPMLKSGGLMFCDDYMWNYNKMPSQDTPFIAINSFLSCFKGKIEAISVSWKTVVIKKL